MITLLEIADFLAEKVQFDDIYVGCIDAKNQKQIGIYIRSPSLEKRCIGGFSSYQTAKIRILIHWTDNPTKTQKKAHEIAEIFENIRNENTENNVILWCEIKGIHPIGKDEKGISEILVDTDIFYRRKNL